MLGAMFIGRARASRNKQLTTFIGCRLFVVVETTNLRSPDVRRKVIVKRSGERNALGKRRNIRSTKTRANIGEIVALLNHISALFRNGIERRLCARRVSCNTTCFELPRERLRAELIELIPTRRVLLYMDLLVEIIC